MTTDEYERELWRKSQRNSRVIGVAAVLALIFLFGLGLLLQLGIFEFQSQLLGH